MTAGGGLIAGYLIGMEMRAQPGRYRTLGIIGGMGPWATVDFLSKIVSLTHAAQDQDHLPVIVHSVPQIPDRSAAILTNSDAPLDFLVNSLRTLEQAGAEVLAMPCNTAHHWHPDLAAVSKRPLLHVVDAVMYKLREGKCDRVGLLARRGMVASAVYQQRLAGVIKEVLTPDSAAQQKIDAVIDAVKAGRRQPELGIEVAEQLLARGAQRVILGCTELPVAFAGADVESYCLDATAALAEACIIACGGSLRGPGERAPI